VGDSRLALLVAGVGAVGVLHTIVPDHWAPIALLARQRNWSRRETARVAAGAGLGHAISTLAIGALAFFAGALAAQRLGRYIDLTAGWALVGFGVWTVIEGVRELRARQPLQPATGLPSRTALMLVLGSSPSIEVVPAFLAAAPLGVKAFVALALVFSIATIATYVITCALSSAGLERIRFPAFERYGEVIAGSLIASIGLTFLVWFRP